MNALLDTSFVLEQFRSNPVADTAFAASDTVAINLITLGELLAGGERRLPVSSTRGSTDEFLQAVRVIDLSTATAERYAELRHATEILGLRPPQNDLWIAATAVEWDLVLLTFDHHFANIPGLRSLVLK